MRNVDGRCVQSSSEGTAAGPQVLTLPSQPVCPMASGDFVEWRMAGHVHGSTELAPG